MPTLSTEHLGLAVVAMILLTRWLWDYNRSRREDSAEHEPRATPALHTVYATKEELAELKKRVEKISDEIKSSFTNLADQREESIAGLHDDIRDKTEALRIEIKGDITGVHDRMTDVLASVHRMEGAMKNLRQ